jgi:hypothetical protein
MSERWIYAILAIAAIGLGLDSIISERGSHIFGRIGPRYTGVPAIIEGIVFIAFGCGLFYWAWKKRDQSPTK